MNYEYVYVGAANPSQITALVNQYGIEGWRVIHISNNPIANQQPWVAFLERETKAES